MFTAVVASLASAAVAAASSIPKLEELLLPDLFDFAAVEGRLVGFGCLQANRRAWIEPASSLRASVTTLVAESLLTWSPHDWQVGESPTWPCAMRGLFNAPALAAPATARRPRAVCPIRHTAPAARATITRHG